MIKIVVVAVALTLILTGVYTTPVTNLTGQVTASLKENECINTVICPEGFDIYKVCHSNAGCSITCVPFGTNDTQINQPNLSGSKGDRKKAIIDFLANGTFDTKAHTITFNIN